MFAFKRTKGMLPSQVAAYVQELEQEVERLTEHLEEAQKPTHFVSAKAGDNLGSTREELTRNLEIGQITKVAALRRFETGYAVKITEHRIDICESQTEAEKRRILFRL